MKFLAIIFLLGLSFPAKAARCDFEANGLGDHRDLIRFIEKMRKVKTAGELARYAQFPLKLNIKPEKIVLKNVAQFKKQSKAIMTEKVKKALLTANYRFAYCDKQGVMLGKGNIWLRKFKDSYKIVAINP